MENGWTDPRVPAADVCVLRDVLERYVRTQPDKVFLRFADGGEWTYRQMREEAVRAAHGLRALGVKQGEHVLSWLPNGRDAFRVWFGLNYLGAVYVPVNLAYRGSILAHVVENSDARLIVAHAELCGRLGAIDRAKLEEVVVIGGEAGADTGLAVHPAGALLAAEAGEPPALERPIMPWDTQSIIYTSGTTGPSKGVLSSYLHLYSMGAEPWPYFGPDDRGMCNLPLFHAGGTGAVYRSLVRGASVAVFDAFSTQDFWRLVREHGVTTTVLLGVMATFLVKQPPSEEDRGHGLKSVTMVPLCEDAELFSQRFGVEVYTTFNMTETSCPIVSERNPAALSSCGKPRAGVAVRIVDANDCEVPVGEVGELVVRTDRPWAMNHGYYKNPEATAKSWRNGWFHTGDAFRMDAAGDFFFVDRMKDAIRRRGENISSFEVETEICAHPAVKEAAVVAVPSEFAEDEVLAAVSLTDGAQLDPAELIAFLLPRMAHFMVPRYVRVLPDLPKTPTQKVQKHIVRSDGITADTWDREAAGIRIKREKIGISA
ncbi:AMP-binding protein [Chelatococcus reniformis]|uniref:ATP-dependent acyl-CoA ligase n=1 Tax=Chelatococcus reniformis TaxID=1494448 RepID=A0A916XNE7_9HYPH|nr:AMP-binding protein [Chelatococcus reniformis]GGC86588.1 ATP-dependent acyl-CoA ligase [Chelatococcus reniformis]